LLGEMRELGAAEEEGCRQVGERAAAGSCDVLIAVGERARAIGEAARSAGLRDVRYLASNEDAIKTLQRELRKGDQLLIKGSRAVALETIVEALAAV